MQKTFTFDCQPPIGTPVGWCHQWRSDTLQKHFSVYYRHTKRLQSHCYYSSTPVILATHWVLFLPECL